MESSRIIQTTAVHLTEEEAKMFISFQKHYALIGLLQNIGAFDLKSGYIKIHFNKLSEIQSVEKKEYFIP